MAQGKQKKKKSVSAGAAKAPGKPETGEAKPEVELTRKEEWGEVKKLWKGLGVGTQIATILATGVGVVLAAGIVTTVLFDGSVHSDVKNMFNNISRSIERNASERAWEKAAGVRESTARYAPKGISAYLTAHRLHGSKLPDGLTIAFSTPTNALGEAKLVANGFATVSNWNLDTTKVIDLDKRKPSYCNVFRITAAGAVIGTQRAKPPVDFYQVICIEPPAPDLG